MGAVRAVTRALIVFHDHGCHWLDPLLRPGFRHVLCAIDDGRYWIQVDGRTGRPVIELLADNTFPLADHYRGQDFTVLDHFCGDDPVTLPLTLTNCVGLVKTTLGIRSLAVTPYQLYRSLTS